MSPDSNDAWRMVLDSAGEEQTRELGRRIGAVLQGGDVVGLVGPLGAGKTQLAKGLAVGLGVRDSNQVNSPTFVLVNEYDGRLHVYHLDVYRLSGVVELEALGFEEMCSGAAVVMVEWADRIGPALGPETLWVELSPTGATRRRLTLHTRSSSIQQQLDAAGLDPAG